MLITLLTVLARAGVVSVEVHADAMMHVSNAIQVTVGWDESPVAVREFMMCCATCVTAFMCFKRNTEHC